ncbi:tRNA (adenosine(37)-N6)-threonylcarbamoyltransferase complex dimerization subunit type 1 TsaB [Roseospira navarrensis]|uniref:tRNA (adenosine(37)-N6)-threonylcarbamoyltransferase complex dimerization subunit type 1 TsaB n=1 Tax=Roseospira navarrensis TaxID=140058 RepID=UPI0031B58B7F
MSAPGDGPVLALDTAAGACSVCLWRAGTVLAEETQAMAHGHAEALAPMVDRVARAAGVGLAELGAVAVTVGPGSFTGLRVGLAFARGLGLAVGCPVLGATTTAVLAAMARAPSESSGVPIAVVLDARRAEVYLQVFNADGTPRGAPVSVAPEAVADRLPDGPGRITGDGSALLPRPLPPEWVEAPDPARPPAPAILAALVSAPGAETVPPRPLYIRPPDATLPPPNARAPASGPA